MVKPSALLLGLLCSSLLYGCSRGAIVFDYNDQPAWPPICNADNRGRQSPINIITANVVEDPTLSALELSSTWSDAVSDGTFMNNGHSVQLTLDNSTAVTTQTPVGNYKLVQMHFHWGSMTGTGSEHRIDGDQSELEVHFVHSAVETGANPGRGFAVIGVLAEVSSEPISGAWQILDISQLVDEGDSIPITDFTLSSLLPEREDYYYYPGSLTTPPCTESVQWFVLKNRIQVPAAYLEMLRMIRGENGVLTYNFRMVQELNSRVVSTPASSGVMTTSSLLSVLSLAILVIATLK